MNTSLEAIGQRMQELRKRSSYTREEVCEKIEKSLNSLSYYENGNVSMPAEVIIQLSELYGCSTDLILTGKQAINNDTVTLSAAQLLKELELKNKFIEGLLE